MKGYFFSKLLQVLCCPEKLSPLLYWFFFNSSQFRCLKILPKHLPRYWASYATVFCVCLFVCFSVCLSALCQCASLRPYQCAIYLHVNCVLVSIFFFLLLIENLIWNRHIELSQKRKKTLKLSQQNI